MRKLLCSITGLNLGKSGFRWTEVTIATRLPILLMVQKSGELTILGYINLVQHGRNYIHINWLAGFLNHQQYQSRTWKRFFYRNVYGSSLPGGSFKFPLAVPRNTHIAPLKWWLRDDNLLFGSRPMFKGKLLVLSGGSPFKFRDYSAYLGKMTKWLLGLKWNRAQVAFASGHSGIWCQELGARPSKGKHKRKILNP